MKMTSLLGVYTGVGGMKLVNAEISRIDFVREIVKIKKCVLLEVCLRHCLAIQTLGNSKMFNESVRGTRLCSIFC
jgi:hypothetical protein